jgi:hypothetical protein
MVALQDAIAIANQERDQAIAARTAAEAVAAQAMVDLTTANAAATVAATANVRQVTFALSPALASNTMLDYKTSEGIKIYGKATLPLDSLFDGDPELYACSSSRYSKGQRNLAGPPSCRLIKEEQSCH